MKKLCISLLTSLMVITSLNVSSNNIKIEAQTNPVNVTTEDGKVTIGNEYIERSFSTKDQILKTENILNKRTDGSTNFIPTTGSEEFKIRLTKQQRDPISLPAIDRTGWTAVESSREHASGPSDGPASNLLDGDINSIWHSNYASGIGPKVYPYHVLFTLNGEKTFQSFSYTPRKEGVEVNGNIKGYELWVANSEETLTADATQWVKVANGSFSYNGTNPIYVNLEESISANQVKFVATSAVNGNQFAGGAEFNLHEEKAPIITEEREFSSSALTLDTSNISIEDTTATINNIEKTGKKIVFPFETYVYNDIEYTINQVIVMYEGDHFMRKYLEISVPDEQKDKVSIDYIDLESLNVNESDSTWTIPTNAGGIVEMSQYKANLGQPIYIQGMFFGCEFPTTDTQIVDGNGRIRYYTGKTFDRLEKDNQAIANNGYSTYVTWQTVAGAARSTEKEVIQADFFTYINSIATPSEFRIQYNSWFDNMMKIDDQNILESFIEIDRELNKVETRPLDSYVIDDGWINYNNTYIVDEVRTGNTLNKTGFWELNSKFPEGLTPSSELVHNFGSNFGVWVGPRGGYNFFGHLADIITKSGKGSKAGGSIDVADRKYLKNLTEMFTNWQAEYKVNYWKWDGFADRAQYGQFPASDGVPGYANDHMTGGYENMYHVTDLWEGWIDLFEATRDSEQQENINKLWLSLTCYVNPSPWYLQWANSVWIQCTADQADAGPSSSKMDRQLTYRDACYYDFLKKHEFQFPLANIYNHDPVYGKEGTGMNKNTATDEQFKNYLYMQSTRGTAFWELYYSDSIMTDGKYEVTSEFLAWAEENNHILRNAKMIGGHPNASTALGGGSGQPNANDAYGFSCFDGTDGILSLRNPANAPRDITFTFDRKMGVPENAGTLNYHFEHTYNLSADTPTSGTLEYGKTYTITLQPDEVRVLTISSTGDKTAPKFTRAFSDGNKTITVKFDEKVDGSLFTVEGANIASIAKNADSITYQITLTKALANAKTLKVKALDIKDLAGNAIENDTISFTNYTDNVIINTEEKALSGSKVIADSKKAIQSNNSFSVHVDVNTTANNKVLIAQENGYLLGINEEGKAYFELNGAKAISKEVINDGTNHTISGVKENNGILKLYIDGTLTKSAYDASNRYFLVKAGDTTLGSEGFSGDIKAAVYNIGYGYNEVAELINPPVEDKNVLDPSTMSISVSGTSEGDKANIFDKDPTTFWTSQEKAGGIEKGNPSLTIDLDGEKLIEGIDYTKRFFNGPENYWKCTGNLLDYIIEVSADGGATWTTVSTGATVVDATSTSDKVGGTTNIKFDPIKATHVRISGTKSYHWQASSANKFMTIGDLVLYGEKEQAVNLAENKPVIGKWTSDNSDVPVNSDKPFSFLVDGNKDINSYADFGVDNKDASAYVQIDLEATQKLAGINLYRYFADARTYKGTVIAVSKDASFKNPTIVYNSDADNKHELGVGSDATYAETSNGKSIVFNNTIEARYIRVYMHGSSAGNTNHIIEVEARGYKSDTPTEEDVDMSILIEKLAAVSAIDKTSYSIHSKTALTSAMVQGYALLAMKPTQAQVDAMVITLNEKEAALVSIKALQDKVEEYKDVVKGNYTDTSWSVFAKEFNDVKLLIESTEEITQAQVDEKVASVSDAFTRLEEKADSAMKAALKTIIDKAEAAVASDSFENLAPAVQALITLELANAKAVYENPSSTDTDYMNASVALAKALHYLDFVADKKALKALIDTCDALDLEAYSDGVEEFSVALANAKEVYEDENALQARIDVAFNELTSAKEALVEIVVGDKTALVELIKMIKDTVKDGSAYKKDDAWTAFETALTNADKVAQSKYPTDAQIQTATNELLTTFTNIRLLPSEEILAILNSFIEKADAAKAEDYNANDYAFIMEVRSRSAALVKDYDKKEYKTLEKDLVKALELLENKIQKPSTPEVEKPVSPVTRPNTGVTPNRRPAQTVNNNQPNTDVEENVKEPTEVEKDTEIEDEETPQAAIKTPTDNTNNWLFAGLAGIMIVLGCGYFFVFKKKRM